MATLDGEKRSVSRPTGTSGVEAIFLSPAEEFSESAVNTVSSASHGQQELWTRQPHQQPHEVRFKEQNNDVSTPNDAHSKSSQKALKDASRATAGKSGDRHISIQQQQQQHGDVQQLRHHPLRKSRSVSDVPGVSEAIALSSVTSTSSSASVIGGGASSHLKHQQQKRRMSISVTSTSNTQSRRSSIGGGSIIISLSRPDSPVPFIIQSSNNENDQTTNATASATTHAANGTAQEDPLSGPPHILLVANESLEFLRLRRTATTVHMVSRAFLQIFIQMNLNSK